MEKEAGRSVGDAEGKVRAGVEPGEVVADALAAAVRVGVGARGSVGLAQTFNCGGGDEGEAVGEAVAGTVAVAVIRGTPGDGVCTGVRHMDGAAVGVDAGRGVPEGVV